MGFLDHSTNNIIIDAVLTDTGRKMLADNRGRFRIAFFSLADDEVDYQVIEKFGRSVGKEKIAKNTPIFEAQTLGSLAVKHRLLTLPDPTVVRLPRLSLQSTSIEGGTLMFKTTAGQTTGGTDASTTNEVTLTQVIDGTIAIPDGVSDTTFTVQVPDRFLTISAKPWISIEPTTRVASYSVTRDRVDENSHGAVVKFTLTTNGRTLDDTVFNIYGGASGKIISAVVSVIGDQSGIRKDIEIQIQRP